MNNIGVKYEYGRGIPKNYEKAMNWYLKSAKKGNGLAMNNIGYFYQNGLGVPVNYETAMNWYLKAADK